MHAPTTTRWAHATMLALEAVLGKLSDEQAARVQAVLCARTRSPEMTDLRELLKRARAQLVPSEWPVDWGIGPLCEEIDAALAAPSDEPGQPTDVPMRDGCVPVRKSALLEADHMAALIMSMPNVFNALFCADGEYEGGVAAMDRWSDQMRAMRAAVYEYRKRRDSPTADRAAPQEPPASGEQRHQPFDFIAHLQRQRDWSSQTFGPGARTLGVIEHIRKELREIEADPSDVTEWIDVAILALDGAWRAGYQPQQIIDALVAKQTKNEGRIWPDWRTMPENSAIEHDRSGEQG